MGEKSWFCKSENACNSGSFAIYRMSQGVPSTSESSSTSSTSVRYECAGYTTMTTGYEAERYIVTGYNKKTVEEPVYSYKTYYRYRDVVKTPDKKDIKWSYYNDKSLLDYDYTYTGRTDTKEVCK